MKAARGNIIWLSSYPKSGNTWMRAMLTALLRCEGETPDLANLIGGTELNERQFLDDWCAVNSADLPKTQLLPYVRTVRLIAADLLAAPTFIKTHDRFGVTPDGLPLFPAEATRAAIYLVRNPFDVAVSLAAHNGSSLDAAITLMADPGYAMHDFKGRTNEFIPVDIGDWSSHIGSWLDQTEVPVLLLRYEDMLADPVGALGKVIATAGFDVAAEAVADAVRACEIERLQAAERARGFSEKPAGMKAFFRQGRAGEGHEVLSVAQREAIIAAHSAMMTRLGYVR